MNVNVLAIGKIKEPYLKEGIGEYARRLKPYLNFEIWEGPEEEAPERLSEKQRRQLIEREGQFFLAKIKTGQFTIGLDSGGRLLSSPELAALVADRGMMAGQTCNFLIGGSLGLAAAVKDRCDCLLSFGRVTFPHQLVRLMLTEQIYRAVKIIRHEPYHK